MGWLKRSANGQFFGLVAFHADLEFLRAENTSECVRGAAGR
jgi:hypothetical protein